MAGVSGSATRLLSSRSDSCPARCRANLEKDRMTPFPVVRITLFEEHGCSSIRPVENCGKLPSQIDHLKGFMEEASQPLVVKPLGSTCKEATS